MRAMLCVVVCVVACVAATAEIDDPWISLRDGIPVTQVQVPRSSTARAVSLASGDLDRDGSPDVVAGFSTRQGVGRIEVHLDAPSWTRSGGSAAEVEVYDTTGPPDFLEVGDFDGDGLPDVLAAARGSDDLQLLSGNGRGNLLPAVSIRLPGALTSLVAGEFNRADGLTDVLAGVVGPAGPMLLVFQHTGGALAESPALWSLPVPAETLALGQFDGHHARDVAVGAGNDILVVHGDDPLLSRPAEVPSVTTVRLPEPVVTIVAGRLAPGADARFSDLAALTSDGRLHFLDFATGGQERSVVELLEGPLSRDEVSLRIANLSPLSGHDVIVADRRNREIRIHRASTSPHPARLAVPSGVATILPLRLNGDGLDDLVVASDGEGASLSLIETSPRAIFTVDSALDTADAAPGDGTCADSLGRCTLRAALQEVSAVPGPHAIDFALGAGTPTIAVTTALPSVSQGLTLDGATGGATRIELNGAATGMGTPGLQVGGIAGDAVVIRSLVINRFDGAGIRITSSSDVTIENCYIGTDAAGGGTVAGNDDGIEISGPSSSGIVIGGSSSAARNVISGNARAGIDIGGGSGTTVAGNYIGTDATGSGALPNGQSNVRVGGSANLVGGSTTTPGAPPGNVVAAGARDGIEIPGSPSVNGNLVQGNLIGTTAGGGSALGNTLSGVSLRGGGHTVGGSIPALRNVISGNGAGAPDQAGIDIDSTQGGNVVQGNYIGLDVTGTIAIPNSGDGVLIRGQAGHTIGGTSAAPGDPPGNVISGNVRDGIRLDGNTPGVIVEGNRIGTQAGTLDPLGNGGSGFLARNGGGFATVGGAATAGTCSGVCNLIAYNGTNGITLTGSGTNEITIRGNSILDNVGLGIDLRNDGVTPNDLGDGDGGENELLNFPVITGRTFGGGNTTVQGTLNSADNATYTIEVFSNSAPDAGGNGEGGTFLGTTSCTTGATGNCTWTLVAAGIHGFLSATSTDVAGNTSEFSATTDGVGVGEALALLVSKGGGSVIDVSFTPACAGADHVAYLGVTPTVWTTSFCGLGTSGSASFDPGTPAAGQALYFVIVGQNGVGEGPYGQGSGGERPEAVGVGACDLPQDIDACP